MKEKSFLFMQINLKLKNNNCVFNIYLYIYIRIINVDQTNLSYKRIIYFNENVNKLKI